MPGGTRLPGIASVMLVAFLTISCEPMDPQAPPSRAEASVPSIEGENVSKSFVANVKALKESKGYRQNCWMIPSDGADQSLSAALCLDLQDQVHLVVFSDDPNRSLERLPRRMRDLVKTSARLRASMHADSFVLDYRNLPVAGIIRVPVACAESFGSEFINSLLDRNYEPGDFGFQYD